MKTRTVLSAEVVQEIKRMYAEVDSNGRRLHSQIEIAEYFGIGETTVYRAVNSRGGYKGHREPLTEIEMERGSAASLRKLFAMNPDIAAKVAADKMATDIAAKREEEARGDNLIKELKGESNG